MHPAARPADGGHSGCGALRSLVDRRKLLGGLLSKGGGEAFGGLLAGFGLGSEADNAEVLKKLEQIENRLSAIETATQQLRGELAHGSFSGLVSQATPIIASINEGMGQLSFIASMRANDPTKQPLAERTLSFIHDHLLYKQQELCLRISGEVGSDGLIKAASKAAKANTRYWTERTSQTVREAFDYYQDAEARLLLLRVEYFNAHPDAYSHDYVRTQIEWVEKILKDQEQELKPSPPPETIADTTTNLDWWWTVAFSPAPYQLVRGRGVSLDAMGQNSQGQLELRPVYEYRLPTGRELGRLLDKAPAKTNWAEWLRDKQNVPLPDPLPYGWSGVFLYSPRPYTGRWHVAVHLADGGPSCTVQGAIHAGALGVRVATTTTGGSDARATARAVPLAQSP